MRVLRELSEIRISLGRTVANVPLYDVSNENSPSSLTGNQNDYVPGNYDVLRLTSNTTGRTITGFSGGVKGRFLRLINVGLYEIVLAHESASSSAANRIVSPTGTNIILNVQGQIVLYYDSSQQRWICAWSTNADRKSCQLRLSAAQSIGNASYTAVNWGTAIVDTGGFWDSLNPAYVRIPESGWYAFHLQLVWDVNGTNLREAFLTDETDYNPVADSRLAVSSAKTIVSMERVIYRTVGSNMFARVWQNCGIALDILVNKANVGANSTYTEFDVAKL